MNQRERREVLIRALLDERPEYRTMVIPWDEKEQCRLLRALMNVRKPAPITPEFQKIQDEYLQEETRKKGIVSLSELHPIQGNLYLWQGDITRLAVDAIVNAANSQMLGCFYPNHGCIDNVIHTYAGIELRLACNELMEKQGREEETGQAKITPAFNLPGKYVIHTVGPIVYGQLSKKEEEQLADCYGSCLKLAEEYHLSSIAFPCISTGEFHFPQKRAADIAIHTVKEFLEKTDSEMKVIFNVFKDEDYAIYRKLL